ncbi:response regulator [Clostridiaceae bacterium M8S5]|nr:response regulator [Clostridiaceae bacterium M8S5]
MFRLLIVDDEIMTSEYIKYVLENEDINVHIESAYDGFMALEKLKKFTPDIIMLDIHMPNMNGIDTANKILKLYPNQKIVILSAYNEFEYAQKAIRLGVKDYLLKPIPPKELINFIKRNLKNNVEYERCLNPNEKLILSAQEYIEKNYNRKLYLREVADYIGFSSYHFSRLFKKYTKQSFTDYVNKIKVDKAIKLIKNTDMSLREIAEKIGYEDISYFTVIFKKYAGEIPSVYRKRIIDKEN